MFNESDETEFTMKVQFDGDVTFESEPVPPDAYQMRVFTTRPEDYLLIDRSLHIAWEWDTGHKCWRRAS